MKNYYNILGVPENASDIAIAEAYKKLAIKFHPDKNSGDLFFAERFKQVNEAYQVLAKKDERKNYDEMLFNYLDAYEILKQQQHNEQLNRSVNRKKINLHNKNNYSWWMIGCVAIVCAGILFWLKDSDNKGFTKGEVYVNEQDTSAVVVEVTAHSLPQHKGIMVSTMANTPGTTAAINPQVKPGNESRKTTPIIVEKQTVAVEGRSLKSDEIDTIINQLQTKNSNKGVRVTQSSNSNIQKDFAIVSILQKNGFKIAGRNYTTQNFNGIQINETGDYLNVIIGKTANK